MSRFEWPRHRDRLFKAMAPLARRTSDREAFVRKALEQVACRTAQAEQFAADELGEFWGQVHGGSRRAPPTPEDVAKVLADAQRLVERGEFVTAAGLYHAAFQLSTFPETGQWMAQSASGLVHSLIAAKRIDDADRFVQQLQTAAPGAVVPVSLLAQVRMAQQRHAEALALFQEVQSKTPDTPSAHLHIEVAMLHLHMGQVPQAEQAARTAVELEAGNVGALKALGLVLLRGQRWEEAQRFLEIARSLDATDEQIDVLLKIAQDRTPPSPGTIA
jgi:tetratricopeptide (TPR) repeat protein